MVAILLRIDLQATVATIEQASIGLLLSAYLMFVPSLLLRSLRWRLLMVQPIVPLSYFESLIAYAFAILIGTVTPGRVGELAKVVHLQQRGNPLGASLFSVLFDRLLDILFLLIFGSGALFSLALVDNEGAWTMALVVIGLIVTVATLWWATRGKGQKTVGKLLWRAAPAGWQARIAEEFDSFGAGARELRLAPAILACMLSAMAWAANFFSVFLLARALGFEIGYFQMASIAAACALVALLPISIVGMGTRDVTLIALLAGYGVEEAEAIALSTLILSMLLANAMICALSLLTPGPKLEWRSTPTPP